MLFVLTATSLLGQSRVFDPSHIDVWLEDYLAGSPTTAIIGTKVQVTLTDPDLGTSSQIETVYANFSQFGAYPEEIQMVWDADISKWKATYQVAPGTLSGTQARVKIHSISQNENEQSIWDDAYFTVNNVPTILTGLEINTHITNPSPEGYAIVGSSVVVSFTSEDLDEASFYIYSSDGSIMEYGPVAMVGPDADNVFTGTWVVNPYEMILPAGNYMIKIIAYDYNLSPNPGEATAIDLIPIESIIISESEFISAYLGIDGNYTATVATTNNTISVHAEFDTIISKVTIDWGHTFPDATPVIYTLDDGILDIQYTIPDIRISSRTILEVKISKIATAAGNYLDTSSLAGFIINKNQNGEEITVDFILPTITVNDNDLYYDNSPATGWLRFSPNSPAVDDYTDTNPDYVNIKLDLEKWGAGTEDDIYGLQLRFEFESRTVYYKDYTVNSPEVSYNAPTLTIKWDGLNNGTSLPEGTYGITLWKLWDEAGNVLDLSNYYIISDEFPPHSHLLNASSNEPQVILNRMHVVIDNTPLAFVPTAYNSDIVTPDDLTFTHHTKTDHYIIDGTPTDNFVHDYWEDNYTLANFSFQAKRDFTVDSNYLRRETGKYWIVLQKEDATAKWYWNDATSTWNDFTGFNFPANLTPLTFTTDTSQNSANVAFNWNAKDSLFTDGTYIVNAYLMDNAGNIIVSNPVNILLETMVEDSTYTGNIALITGIEVTSRHYGGDFPLTVVENDIPNFYLNTDYYDNSRTQDQIEIEVTVNNSDYLVETNDAVTLDLSNLGLGIMSLAKTNFVNNKAKFIITNAQLASIPDNKAGTYTIGPADGAFNLPIISRSIIPKPEDLNHIHEAGTDELAKFKLVRPDDPIYPVQGSVSVSDHSFSPGHPSHTYNALANPANDGIQDSTIVTISVPASTYYLDWKLSITNPVNNKEWSKAGILAPDASLPETNYTFAGLSNDLEAMADSTAYQDLVVKLFVHVTQYADVGYLEAEDPPPATVALAIDNENPKLESIPEIYTYDHNARSITFEEGVPIPAVSSANNNFEITLKTNEPLRTTNLNQLGNHTFHNSGWNVAVLADTNNVIIPGASGEVNSITDLGNNTYKLSIKVNGINNIESPYAKILLRLPWDEAGNPGRYNDPSYPLTADLFHNDSAEISIPIHILNARPWISKIQFTNYQSIGVVEYNEEGTVTLSTQGYINNYTNSSGTLVAWISGGIYRNIVTTFMADVSSISTMANASALPGTAVQEGTLWKITWNITNIRTDLVHNTPKVITISAKTAEGNNQLHLTSRTITLIVDKNSPVVSSTTFDGTNNSVVADGTAKPFTFNVSDALANIYWDTANSISLTFTNGVTHSGLTLNPTSGTVTGNITLPANTAIKYFVATFKVKDRVNNELTINRYINVVPSPQPTNITLKSAFPLVETSYFRPGTDIHVTFNVTNYQRADKVEVKLINQTTGLQVGTTQTITSPTTGSFDRTFSAVIIPTSNVLRADIIVTYTKYDTGTSTTLNTNATNSASSPNTLIADSVLPVITATTGSLPYLTAGSSQVLSFDIADATSGVNWSSPTISFNPATGISIGALDTSVTGKARWTVTVNENIASQRVSVTVTAKDKVDNTQTLTRYLNIMPIPVISNILVSDNSTGNLEPYNWFVPGHDLKVSFTVSNPQRVQQLVVTITANGAPLDSKTYNVGDQIFLNSNMNVIFPALTAADLDGKVIRATITGHTLSYSDPSNNSPSTTLLINSGSYDEINVDTQPVIQSVQFFLTASSNDAIDFLMPTMEDLKVVVKVKSKNNISNPALTLINQIEGTTQVVLDPNSPTIEGSGVDRILTYIYNVDVTELDVNIPELYKLANFKVTTGTNYGYQATDYFYDMIVLGDALVDQYGIIPPTPNDRNYVDVGRAPNHWFAPENNLITEYRFISSKDSTSVGIMADFDRIEDNVPDNWNTTPVLNTEIIPLVLSPGRPVNVYRYLAKWDIVPDYSSVWNAYADGEPIQIDYKYWSFLPAIIEDTTMVRVDKEVPTYDETRYWVATATDDNAPVYEMISSMGTEINLSLKPPAPGTWEANRHLYLKVATKDNDGNVSNPYNGVGTGWVTDPIAEGWIVEPFNPSREGNFFFTEWKLTRCLGEDDLPIPLNSDSTIVIRLQGVEDLVGHKNYVGSDPSVVPIHSNQYVATGPVITMGFTTSSDDGTAASMIAYQKLDSDELDTKTSPYIKPGEKLGFILELNTDLAANVPRSVAVQSIEPILVQINNPVETNDDNDVWHNLAKQDADNPYKWYLDDDLVINPAETVDSLGLKYKVTYKITYNDNTSTQETYTSSWFNVDENNNALLRIDRTSPQFVQNGIVVKSAYSVTDNYVIPGEEVEITIQFTDESAYNSATIKPFVSIEHLDTFIEGVPDVYVVSDADITYDSNLNNWVAHITGLTAKTDPGITSQEIVVNLQDPVKNPITSADKFVEIANEGPIVPIIRGAKYLTQIYDGSWKEVVVEPVGTGTVHSKIEVYIDVKYPEYIDEVSIDAVPGFTIPVDYTIRPATQADKDLINNNSIDYVAVFDSVSATGMVEGNINLTAHTKRIPYNAEIFTHSYSFSTPVDIMDYTAGTPVVQGRDIDNNWINDLISPERRMRIIVQATDLGENFPDALPADISGWFTLTSDPADLLTNIPAPVITDSHKATWTILPANIEDLSITEASITITYQNIYGLTQTVTHNFNVDNVAPQYAGMQLYLGDDVKADDSSGSFFYADSWDRIRVSFQDLPNVYVGLHSVNVTFTPDPVTYSYDPSQYPQAAAALYSMLYSPLTINDDGSGYVDISFTAPYTGTTLANGRYIITIADLKDKFGATVPTFEKFFDWQYNPAMMTIYINGATSNFEVNVSNAPINIIANTNSSVGPIQGVEFRLFYDADGDEVFTAADFSSEITSHLDNIADMEFPYETHWNMTDDLYAFIQDAAYENPDREYRGFWLRASVITQTRDLYDVVQYVKVWDNVAPVAEPDLTEIVKSIDYAHPANNNLNIPVYFNIRDAVTVQADIYSADTIVHSINQVITNPLGLNLINWDFNGFLPGNYNTQITAWDYIGNFSVTPGPNILLENDISNAIATVNILKHEDINNEISINGREFASNPISDANDYIILEGRITNPASTSGPLNGIASVTFGAKIIDNTGINADIIITPVPNDVGNQPQIPAEGEIPSNLIYVDSVNNTAIIRLAVPNDFFTPYIVNGTDYSFNFNMSFTPTAMYEGIELPEQDYSWFSVDQLAPQVVIINTSTNDPVSWAPGKQGSFSVTPVNPVYDNHTEITSTLLEWSVDGTNWSSTVPQLSYDNIAGVYNAKNWNIAGGSQNTFLGENYFGPVQIRVIVEDNVANADTVYLVPPIIVDNQAPETRFTHVIHSVNYPNLTEILDIPDAPDELSIVTSSQQGTNGASNLRLFVDAGTLGTDNVVPLMMYQRTPDGTWQNVEYDHEAWNLGNSTYPELFEFEIPYSLLSAGQHRFVVVRRDAMGNLEGDKASETVAYNNKLSNAEKLAATDLIVNVTLIDDIIATIEYPEDMAFISGKKAITATTTDNNAVKYIRFEHKENDIWQPIATVEKATKHTIDFELNIEQLGWVPGVHLIANGAVLGELVYDGDSWNGSFELNVGTTYNFQYGIDINNNGTWDQDEPAIADIHGFNTFTPLPWTINFNSADYAQGIHEFRAVPLDASENELAHYQSPSSWMFVDNIAPIINNITSVGNVNTVTPGTNVDFVTDVEELLVAVDDIVEVIYQYSGIQPSEMRRKWKTQANSNQMAGNYPVTLEMPHPMFDDIDNNANGLVDEAEEANSTYFIRAIAIDKAGNFAVSSEFAVNIDASPAKMALTQIEDTILASTNYIYAIDPNMTTVTLTAEEIPTGFDPATEAEFFYKFKAEVTDQWSNDWIPIGQRVNVVNGIATAELDFIQEGYYQFQVVAYDALGNNEYTITNVIFNDVTGPEIIFTQVGTRPVISEKYAFAKQASQFNGDLIATLSEVAGVNTVTFEYSTTGVDNWINITTLGAGSIIPDGNGGGTISYNWNYFPTRTPVLYLRAIAQDNNANNMSTEVIKLYVDTLPPNVEVVNLTHTIYADTLMAVDRTQDVTVTLNYTELNNDGLLDIAKVKLRFYNSNGLLVLHRNKSYVDVGMAETVFTFTPVQMAGMGEDIYRLSVVLEDFAGNTVTLQPSDYQVMYFDVYAPDIKSVVSIAPNVNKIVAYNHPITFEVNYTDLIGIPLDALKVYFKINNVVRDSVQTYTVVDSTHITFTWTPIDFDNHFAFGDMNDIIVNAELTLKDYMEHISPVENFNVFITYGIPNVARIMIVQDVQNGEDTIHYVNWNNPEDLSIGIVNEAIGTKQDGGGAPVKLYAYIPHNAEIPDSLNFAYRALGSTDWNRIDSVSNGVQWDFIDPSLTEQFQSQFSADWDIAELPTGIYEVQVAGNYNPGSTTSVIRVNIYNETIVPQAVVENIEPGNIVQRGNTYTLTSNFTNTDYLSAVRYQYRYVNVNGSVITPVSNWTDFGDDFGVPTEVWNDATTNYSYDWFVAPYYLFNNTMQIVAQAKDIWGTITPISSVITGNAYAIANIRDTEAPDVAISYTWNGLTYPDLDPEPDWISGVIDSTLIITATITSDVMLADLVKVEFKFN
ncbi:MAG TPA: hypothetical protein PLZ47_06460, partial [Candidatus Cloacimonas acidaminovorans]|nr:hypothetical protein [Candidatus Cloacimonas acidaminovorans]